MTVFDNDTDGYVANPAPLPDLAAALISTAAHTGFTMHISKTTVVDKNRHDTTRISTIGLVGHISPVWNKTLPAVTFDAVFDITYAPNSIGVEARLPVAELMNIDITDATDDAATARAVNVTDSATNTPRVRGSIDVSKIDNAPTQFVALITEQMEMIRHTKDDVPQDLTEAAIKTALTNAAKTTGIALDALNIDFNGDHGAMWDDRDPMVIVRGEISLRNLDHIRSSFYITFDAPAPTRHSTSRAASIITVRDIGIELLPRVNDTACSAFEECDIHITGLRDDVFALVVYMLTGQVQRYMASITGVLPESVQ